MEAARIPMLHSVLVQMVRLVESYRKSPVRPYEGRYESLTTEAAKALERAEFVSHTLVFESYGEMVGSCLARKSGTKTQDLTARTRYREP